MPSRSLPAIAARAAVCLLLVACGGKKFEPRGGPFLTTTPTTNVTSTTCPAARSSEPLVPRVDLTGMSASTVGGQNVAYTTDLFGEFLAFCGQCHADGSEGNRHIDKRDLNSFVTTFDDSWLAPVMSDDPKTWMPPSGRAWSTRAPGDAIYEFVTRAESWISQGRPRGVYSVDDGSGGGTPMSATANYAFAPAVAAAMTNIGNCVPTSALFASSTSDVMTSMDTFFATATALPRTLAETDLTSLDSEELAKTAVIAYAPTYALWSAGSGKLRHIRVPRGASVKFDKTTQSWKIPDNTRFYKTFLRKITDRTGAVTWRKMETRVIVARADDVDPASGANRQNALYGTYIWNEDETAATFAQQPYRDLKEDAWGDIVRTYITDELLYQNILDTTTGTVDGAVAMAIKSHPDNPAYRDLLQHYAIPGKLRCVQCHMGSQTQDFVLGFLPLQIKRRETGTGGTYDATGADELTQLQRLIDVGVITGITSPDDVKPLEESEGERKPRKTASAAGDDLTDDGELKAQAYMLGNCAHCHNPRGFPSISKPELAPVLNFLPDGKDGGIFQFAFETYSPIRARGADGDIPIPYITPSLRDYPTVTSGGTARIDNGQEVTEVLTYSPKFFTPNDGSRSCADMTYDPDFRAYCGDRTTGPPIVAAPWRSLIYRNVDTPAAYFDDFVPFPHMPMNTAGYDCRAPRIMGDWMAGLPSVRKLVQLATLVGQTAPSEDALPALGGNGRAPILGSLKTGYDDNPQPYIEVPPDSPQYAQALADARTRVVEYHQGVRYQYCQDVISPDIFDPFVPVNAPEYVYHPDPNEYQILAIEDPPLDPMHPDRFIQPRIGVPLHAHWINYDPTDPPPPWVPRRDVWEDVIVNGHPDTALPVGNKSPEELEADGTEAGKTAAAKFRQDRAIMPPALQAAQLTDALRSFATTEKPFALWQARPDCGRKLASQKTVSQFSADQRPEWFDVTKADPAAPVYMMSPGAFVFRHVCINCHGPNADGKGIQVDLLSAASEGEARPANFRSGLFGPPEMPLSNLVATFDIGGNGDRALADQWASRYMAWMALGGTLKRIPQDILHLVAATPVFGNKRQNLSQVPGAADPTGNMLNLAKGLCSLVLPAPDDSLSVYVYNSRVDAITYPPYNQANSPFVVNTYDREMWLHLCSDFSPQIVRVYGGTVPGQAKELTLIAMFYAADPADPNNAVKKYPANGPIWNHKKQTKPGIDRDNLYPACLDPQIKPENYSNLMLPPPCDPAFLANAKLMWRHRGVDWFPSDDAHILATNPDIETWTLRGGIAAGMSVFSYLEKRISDPTMAQLPPYYDQCEQLP